MKHEIKHRWSGEVLFSSDTADSWRVTLEEALRSGADLSGANLRDADLSDANLSDANLRDADLRDADLSDANLSGAYLSDANLRGADLSGANLSGANLRDANLSGADLSDANLRDANLRGAYLSGAKGINKYLTSPLYMLFDQAGPIRSYKLVNAEMEGPFVGGTKYEIGVTVAAEEADTDESQACGAGINVATLDWCLREWRDGYKILLVEHEVSDIACIPIGSDGKYRVHRCRVIAEKDLSQIGVGEAAKVGAA